MSGFKYAERVWAALSGLASVSASQDGPYQALKTSPKPISDGMHRLEGL